MPNLKCKSKKSSSFKSMGGGMLFSFLTFFSLCYLVPLVAPSMLQSPNVGKLVILRTLFWIFSFLMVVMFLLDSTSKCLDDDE